MKCNPSILRPIIHCSDEWVTSPKPACVAGLTKSFLCPWGRVALSVGRVAQGDSRPRSWSSRTHRSTWLFCRSTRSTSSTSRRFYDSTRLGWFPIDLIDLVDLRPCRSQLSARACLLHGNWCKKICVQAPDAFPVPSGRPTGLAFLFSFYPLIFS